jgi:drug/metabolite transporter (DMT)-like permease
VAFSAYNYLLQNVRPTLATSYAYVNPGVAVLLGVSLQGEGITVLEVAALLIILVAVALVITGQRQAAPP